MISTDFPEDIFLADNTKLSIYKHILDLGSNICKEKSILFCGICRDVGDVLERNILRIHRTGKMFKDYSIYIYENDSSDNTVEILKKYQDDKLKYVSETREDKNYRENLDNGVDPWHSQRCNILADCRNNYLSYAQSLSNIDYICVIDLDIKGGWSYDGIKHGIFTLNNEDKAACVSSYGVLTEPTNISTLEEVSTKDYIMYDSFAFRANGVETLHMLRLPTHNRLHFVRGDNPLEVFSNFGGLAIYKLETLANQKYSSREWKSGYVDPDHVMLNRSLRNLGYKILLDPSMIVSYSNHRYST